MRLGDRSLGDVLAVIVIIMALLMMISVIPATPVTIGAFLVALAVARLF
jgi:hypothetical protein